jgi:hypothetical protein
MSNGLFYLSVAHDDWCLYWTTNDPARCNCEPVYEQIEVTDENVNQVGEQLRRDMESAQKTRQGKQN